MQLNQNNHTKFQNYNHFTLSRNPRSSELLGTLERSL